MNHLLILFIFQRIIFYNLSSKFFKECIDTCPQCTQHQVIKWRGVFPLDKYEKTGGVTIALPGELEAVHLRLSEAKFNNLTLDWIDIQNTNEMSFSQVNHLPELQKDNLETESGFPVYNDYNKHPYIIKAHRRTYYFVKYMHRKHNPKYVPFFAPTYLKTCPNFIHEAKLFSWKTTLGHCKGIHGSLPQFISRKDQEELINIIKSANYLFPVEAVFLGLKTHTTGKVMNPYLSCIYMSLFALWQIDTFRTNLEI